MNGVKACVFDAYGTLLDLSAAVEPLAAGLEGRAPDLLAIWRQKQLEYTWLRSLMGRYADFAQVTSDALDYACDVVGSEARLLKPELLKAFARLPAYPEAQPLLRSLRAAGLKTAVLSNGTFSTLRTSLGTAGLLADIDVILSVDSVGTYKPSPPVYHLPSTALGLPVDALAFVSAHAWDAAGAAAVGLQAIWLNRGGAPRERLPEGPAVQVRSLADVDEALRIFGPVG